MENPRRIAATSLRHVIQPLVSVIVPCYNQGGVVGEAIDSALSQSYPRCEVVVVDDGSTDGTAAVVAGFGARVTSVSQPNRGLSAARNAGIARANGSVIGLLDADDRWLPHKLTIETTLFQDPEVGVVHGSYRKFPATHPRAGNVVKVAGAVTTFHEIMGFNTVGAPVSALVRRSVLEEAGGFDDTLVGGEDWDLWIRLAERCRIVGSEPLTAEYRLSDQSMSRRYETMYRALNDVIDKHKSHHRDCRACHAAVRRARQQVRAYYCDAAARAAFEERRAGHPLRYLQLRLRGICRNPRVAKRILPGIVRRIAARLA